MRNVLRTVLLALAFVGAVPAEAKVTDLLPKPHIVTTNQGEAFLLGREVNLDDPTDCAYLRTVLTNYGCSLKTGDSSAPQVSVQLVDEIPGAFNHDVNLFPDEAYSLEVSANAISIKALTTTGVIRAAQTLQQLAEGYEGTAAIEALKITDWPAFKVRGFMHDVGRSFLSFEELKKEIDLLARFKVNVFHWHLTEKLAWRMEIEAYPQLTADENMIRYPGSYYTKEQCRELEAYAAERGVIVIPEIDMPGHSDVFTKAMGFSMQTDQGVAALKNILDEVVDVFPNAPYIHIGGDEVTITYTNFLKIMADYVRSKGKKVVMWNRLVAGAPTAEQCDMTQMWATAGKVVKGLPNIDCRYNYTNHFDVYADLVGIYKSNIYYEQKGTADVAGTISAAWNDTKTKTESDIVCQNNIYANILASAERAWMGGGKAYIEKGGTTLPNSGEEFDEFADFERRFLFHKAHSLKDEPISYVRQTNVRWRITDPFPNNGNNALALPPETSEEDILPSTFTWQDKTYASRTATGAGIYLRHIWHPTIPSFFSSPSDNQTAYAWTYIYSPEEQQAAAQIEFYTYSRSGNETAPPAGAWDRRGSKVWLNDVEIAAPEWEQPNASISQDQATTGLTNENLTARPVVPITLKQGWNKVFMRLPHVNKGGTGRDKWQFTFVVTDTEGKNALEGITYSPNKCLDENAERLSQSLDEAEAYVANNFGSGIGYYPPSLAQELQTLVSELRATLSESLSEEVRAEQIQRVETELENLRNSVSTASINLPKASTEEDEFWYTMCTPLRGNRYPTAKGADANLTGETTVSLASKWKFVARPDGSFNIMDAAAGLYISPASAGNTALKTTAAEPEAGWSILPADAAGYVIITSGTVQFNQSNNSPYSVLNWGGGSNNSDTGCKYVIEPTTVPTPPRMSTSQQIYWYQFCTPLRGNRYPTAKGAGQDIVGETAATDNSTWKFVPRQGETNIFDIVNKVDGTFISPASDNNTALKTVTEQPSAGWQFKEAATNGYFVIVSGSSQFNQTNNAGQGWKVFNWGGGANTPNTTDTGCQYAFFLVDTEDVITGILSPEGTATKVPAYYDITGRRLTRPQSGVNIVSGSDEKSKLVIVR